MKVPWPRKAMPNVFLFEPHPLAIEGLRTALKRITQVSVFPCLDSLSLPSDAQIDWSVFVFDKVTHDSAVPSGLNRLRARYPGSKAIIIESTSSPEEQFQMLSLGFKGVLVYQDVTQNLPPAILAVASGGYWVDSTVLEQYVMSRSQRMGSKGGTEDFTQREIEVASLLRRRLSNKEISASLAMSEGTVKFHIANIFSKLGVRDRWAAADIMAFSENQFRPEVVSQRMDHQPSFHRQPRAS